MGEIRLICPGCRVEYRLPGEAIPAEGREVECTACGRVWFAEKGEPAGLDATTSPGHAGADAEPPADPAEEADDGADSVGREPDAAPAVPLSRRLPESVMNILRDEVEHERRARMAEDDAFGRTPALRPAEVDWPATTITGAPEPAEAGAGAPPAPDAATAPDMAKPAAPRAIIGDTRHPGPRPAETDLVIRRPAAQADENAAAAPSATDRGPDAAAAMQAAPGNPTAPDRSLEAARPRRFESHEPSPYHLGLGVAAMTAAACLALYLLAPGLADAGPVGDALIGLRQVVDDGRIWLQAQVDGLFG